MKNWWYKFRPSKVYNFCFKQSLNKVRVSLDDSPYSFVGTNILEEAVAFISTVHSPVPNTNPKMLVPIYQTTWHLILEDCYANTQHDKSLKSYTFVNCAYVTKCNEKCNVSSTLTCTTNLAIFRFVGFTYQAYSLLQNLESKYLTYGMYVAYSTIIMSKHWRKMLGIFKYKHLWTSTTNAWKHIYFLNILSPNQTLL